MARMPRARVGEKNKDIAGSVQREPTPDWVLVGMVNGKIATKPEERFAIALRKNPYVLNFDFRQTPFGPAMTPGSFELDFYVITVIGDFMFQIDGPVHMIAHEQEQDAITDMYFNSLYNGKAQPIVRIPSEELADPDMATEKVKELIG